MDAINCSIVQGNLKFHFVAAIGDNLKVLQELLKLINSLPAEVNLCCFIMWGEHPACSTLMLWNWF